MSNTGGVTTDAIQPELDLESEGVKRYRWDLPTGPLLIEVFVDGRINVYAAPKQKPIYPVDLPARPAQTNMGS